MKTLEPQKWKILTGGAVATLQTLPDECVQTCVTSPPYFGLRSYLPDVVRPVEGIPPEVLQELDDRGITPVALIRDLTP